MGSSAFEEPDDEGNICIDPDGFIRAMARLVRSTTDTESIHLLLSSIRINQEDRQRAQANDKFQSSTRKRHLEEDRRAGAKDDGNKRSHRDVDRHVNNAKGKGKRLVRIEAFECENCERFFAAESALKTHKDSCTQASNAPKSTKYKCTLCNKERANIYNHYAAAHFIEYPEQIMFCHGNVLVRSDIDTKGGKAPWFEKERVKATKKFDDLTCRLCEVETTFCNPEILADHYTLYHMVEPAMLDNLRQLFRAEKGAHLVDLPTSQTPSKRKSATSKQTPDTLNSKYEKGNMTFPCIQCKGKYSTKSNLVRHIKIAHLGKKPEGMVAKKPISNENNKEKNTTKPGDKREPKCEKSKCVFCDKDVAAIYKHYCNKHNIQDPEQLLFVDGSVLVFTSMDTKGGKAPWFLKEAEKINWYTETTCRLCDTAVVYDERVVLEKHYRTDHKVKVALERLDYLFRAEKGAHLADLPASRPPSKQQKITLPQRQGETLTSVLTENKNSHVPATEHTNQKSELQTEKQDANTSLRNTQSDSPIIEDSTAGSHQVNRQPIQILEDIVVSVFCNECNKSIMYSDFEAHAATHNNNQYVEAEDTQLEKIDENAAQEQRCDEIKNKGHQESGNIVSQNDSIETEGNGGGTVEPWNSDNDSCHSLRISSYVMKVDVHVEREESEKNGNERATDYATIDETSEINADAPHQVQDTDEQEEENDSSKEWMEDLEEDLKKLLGPGEIGTPVDKSTSDKNTNTQELQEILEADITEQGPSEINNYREKSAVIENKNNESMIYSNDADANISQDIFISDSDPSEIHNENGEICQLSQDVFSGTTQENLNNDDVNKSNSKDNARIETTTEKDNGKTPNTTLVADVGDMQPNPRPPTGDILCALLEGILSNVNAAKEKERRNEEKSQIQCLIDEIQRIKEILFSRD